VPAATKAIADQADLFDVCGLAGDLFGLGQAVRHRGSRAGSERNAAQHGQANNSSFQFHGLSPFCGDSKNN
jgi:hypothetical protein